MANIALYVLFFHTKWHKKNDKTIPSNKRMWLKIRLNSAKKVLWYLRDIQTNFCSKCNVIFFTKYWQTETSKTCYHFQSISMQQNSRLYGSRCIYSKSLHFFDHTLQNLMSRSWTQNTILPHQQNQIFWQHWNSHHCLIPWQRFSW